MGFLANTEWFLYLGYAAVVSSIITSYMKTMIPLRVVSMICNTLFVIYAFAGHVYPTLFLNMILLPLNAWRLWEMIQLTRKVKAAASGDRSFDWLKPFMSRRKTAAGEILFRKGEEADVLYYTLSGKFRLRESGMDIPSGQVVGELALLASDKRRTQSLECVEFWRGHGRELRAGEADLLSKSGIRLPLSRTDECAPFSEHGSAGGGTCRVQVEGGGGGRMTGAVRAGRNFENSQPKMSATMPAYQPMFSACVCLRTSADLPVLEIKGSMVAIRPSLGP